MTNNHHIMSYFYFLKNKYQINCCKPIWFDVAILSSSVYSSIILRSILLVEVVLNENLCQILMKLEWPGRNHQRTIYLKRLALEIWFIVILLVFVGMCRVIGNKLMRAQNWWCWIICFNNVFWHNITFKKSTGRSRFRFLS